MLCGGVAACHRYGMCVLLAMLSAVLCGGVAACHRYGVCTVGCVECGVMRWCGSMS
jgi:hypothetical protein